VSEFFNEVDEEVRREQLKKLWDRYSWLIVSVAILVVAAVGGWRAFQYWQTKQAAEAGAKFEAALKLSEDNKHAEAEAAFTQLTATAPSGYRMLARFRAAAEAVERDKPAAVKAYDALAADTSLGQTERDLAQLRASALLVDSAPYAEIKQRLEPLIGQDRTFHHSARELLALSAWRGNDSAATRQWIDLITTDSDTPPSLRARIESLKALLPPAAKS
jgi:hypothetical protein